MSTGPTAIMLPEAQRIAQHFTAQLAAFNLEVVGSTRRRAAQVGDIEFIAPLPTEADVDEAGEPIDPLYIALSRRFYRLPDDPLTDQEAAAEIARLDAAKLLAKSKQRVAMLFAPPVDSVAARRGDETAESNPAADQDRVSPRWGTVLKGLKPGFHQASVILHVRHPHAKQVKIEVYRYETEGPERLGNKGWQQMIRTGPREMGMHVLACWKRVTDGGKSQDGYPCTANGERVACPTEHQAFKLAGLPYIEPERRDSWINSRFAGQRRQA